MFPHQKPMVLFCSALNPQAQRLRKNIADAANVWRTKSNAKERERVKKELKLKEIMISHIRKHQLEMKCARLYICSLLQFVIQFRSRAECTFPSLHN
jgi:cell fate regulator YaaT (PSP1 superfamily)